MLPFILKVVYIYIIGFILAVLEIQIEGPHGWAEKLPTWRPHPSRWFVKFYQRLTGQKEFTGYHFFLNIFLLLFFHLPFVWVFSWSWQAELELLAFYIIFVVFWDFLWFVLNPSVSLKDFGPQRVWWHKNWWGKFPIDYYVGILLAVAIFIPLILVDPVANIPKLILLVFGNIILTIITIIIYPKAY